MPRIFALLAGTIAVLFMFMPLTSISAEETQAERVEKNLCEQLPTLQAEVDLSDSKAVGHISSIARACGALVRLRQEPTLEHFRTLRNTIESAKVSLKEVGALKDEIATFKRQEAAQRFLLHFSDRYDAVASKIEALEGGSLQMYTTAIKETVRKFLHDDYGGLGVFLGYFQKVSSMFREILTYRDKIVLCEGEKPLPDVFWNAVSDAHESTGKARFGDARAAFGEARGLLSAYTKDNSLCVKAEAQTVQ